MKPNTGPRDDGYDSIADFYLAQCGGTVEADAVFASVAGLAGDVAGVRVLELACGEGRASRALAGMGAEVVGVDISSRLLAVASEQERRAPLGVTYLRGDVQESGWWDGSPFELVVCNHGLADIGDLDAVMSTASQVLRPGGRFVFSILHPCCPGTGSTTPSAWPPAAGYAAEGWWLADNPGMRGKVGSHFRRVSTYLNTLIGHGFALEMVDEPASDTVPMFLVVAGRRS